MLRIVLVFASVSLGFAFNLTILHTNDVHARYEETNKYSGSCSTKDQLANKCYGGYARLIGKITDLKRKYPNTLVLDAGDQFQGTTWFYHFQWNVTSYFTNLLGYDAMAIGNHEFDNKVSGLVPFLEMSKFPILSANIDASKEPTMTGNFKKSTILSVDGEKIAIIGYTTTDTPSISNTGNLIFNDEVESVRAEVVAIKARDSSINKFIALGHAGFNKDQEIAAVDEIDIVIGGHSNTFLYSGDKPSNEKPEGEYPFVVTKNNGEKVLCVQDYAYGKYLGFLNVRFDNDGKLTGWMGNPILLDHTVPQDNNTLELMMPWRDEINVFKDTKVGETRVFLQGDSKECRTQECNLGNVIADAMLRHNLNKQVTSNWNNASIVLHNSGGIRTPIEQGDITIDDVLTVLPFRNNIDLIDLKGVHLLGALEHSVSRYVPGQTRDLPGGFLQFSGLRVKYDVSRPVGERVHSVKVMCTQCTVPVFEDLDVDKYYTIIISTFLINGGDDYKIIADNKINHIEKGDLDATIVNDYLKTFSPLIQGLDGRIEFVDTTKPTVVCTDGASIPSLYLFSILLCFMFSKCVISL